MTPLGSIRRQSVQGASIFLVPVHQIVYILLGLLLLFSPSLLPKRTCFSSLSFLLLHDVAKEVQLSLDNALDDIDVCPRCFCANFVLCSSCSKS